MQETFSVGISGNDCSERKAKIQEAAKENHMSISGFILWLFDEYQKRQERKKRDH